MERAHWLKALGHARGPLSDAWLEDGGRLGALSGVPARSMSQQSHIRLTPEHYARAVDVLASIAR